MDASCRFILASVYGTVFFLGFIFWEHVSWTSSQGSGITLREAGAVLDAKCVRHTEPSQRPRAEGIRGHGKDSG